MTPRDIVVMNAHTAWTLPDILTLTPFRKVIIPEKWNRVIQDHVQTRASYTAIIAHIPPSIWYKEISRTVYVLLPAISNTT